jgi:small nuclear ribonucleoprotein
VTVHLKDGAAYHGVLSGYDQHMNVVLEPDAGFDEDLLEDVTFEAVEDTTIIRGDNVVRIKA